MSVDTLLSRLEKVKRTGQGRYVARCPAHADKNPTLSIRELTDGRVLVHCFAGCGAAEIVAATGLEMSDLFPPSDAQGNPERRPFPAADALRCVAFEALVVLAAAAALVAGESLATTDRDRLSVASARIQDALKACGL
jgi:hypothetical protein